MTYVAICAVTLLRSLLLVALALPICLMLCDLLRAVRRGRTFAWLLLLSPIVLPRMITGYGYANFSLSLVPYPLWNELFYGLLLLITLVPVGTILLYFAPPPPVSAEARHCLRLLDDVPRSSRLFGGAGEVRGGFSNVRARGCRLGFLFGGRWGVRLPACYLMFLMAFQEFELASLLSVTSWTVWLFDAQTGGLFLSQSLWYAMLPLVCELILLVPPAWYAWQLSGLVGKPKEPRRAVSRTRIGLSWTYLVLAPVLLVVLPGVLVMHDALAGLPQLARNSALRRELMAGFVVSLLATVMAYTAAAWWGGKEHTVHPSMWRRGVAHLMATLSIPGLFGSLVVALGLVALFQLPGSQFLYDTPIPWISGLVLFLLPRAIVAILLLVVAVPAETVHLPRLLVASNIPRQRQEGREILWHVSGALHAGVFVLFFFCAYGDLTLASILAPPAIVSAPVRLYNLMHYGQSAVLSAMVLVTFVFPATLFLMLWIGRRFVQRWLVA